MKQPSVQLAPSMRCRDHLVHLVELPDLYALSKHVHVEISFDLTLVFVFPLQ